MTGCESATVNSDSEINNLKSSGVFEIKNPYLKDLDEDVLFHLQLSTKKHDLKAMFHDVRFVCMGGTARRMRDFANFIMKELGYKLSSGSELEDLTARGHRYSMYKVGCVLCVSHGIGPSSINILLHELIKLMYYAEVSNPVFFRTGTSGGIDVPAGTVVIATEALNDYLEPIFEVTILGKRVRKPAVLDQNLVKELKKASEKLDFPVLLGATVSNDHFYESTAMKVSAICEHTDKDRKEYYERLKFFNVLNMDMEAVALAAITRAVGIRAAVVNVVVNDAFLEEGEAPTEQMVQEWQKRPMKIIVQYIKEH